MSKGEIRALEFFSGIGGMHYAAATLKSIKILKHFDINPNANKTYQMNFPEVECVDTNIEHLDTNYFDEIAADLFLMSPPCQPYTRAGKQLDTKDKRANALVHLAHLIRDMKSPPKFILLENVKNFERSDSCKILLECLAVANYSFQEFILSPVQFGIPNERVRYFLIAKRVPFEYADCLERGNYLMTFIPKNDWFDGDLAVYKLERVVSDSESKNEDYESYQIIPEDKPPLVSQNTIQKTRQIATFLEENVSFEEYKVPDAILQKSVGYCFDIVKSDSIRSACFTKSYGRYVRGTGSILQLSNSQIEFSFENPSTLINLHLRYFTPREIANLHGFPESFQFPSELSTNQRYALLGNSLTVPIVSSLLNYFI